MAMKIIGCFVVLVGAFLVYIAMQPSDILISREIVVNATPDVIFPLINNSQRSTEWMPWKDTDPQAVMTFSGPAEGIGSTSSWDSPGQMGSGKAEVVESIPNQKVTTALTYTKPMEMTQTAEVSLLPSGAGTLVKWSVSGKNSFGGRIMCFFMDMDKVVGKQFEKGLKKLKGIVESGASQQPPVEGGAAQQPTPEAEATH